MPNNRLVSAALLIVFSLIFSSCTALQERIEAGNDPYIPTAAEIEQYNASVPADQQIICRREKPTGSRIAQLMCRRSGAIDETAELTQGQFRRVLR